MTAASPSNRHRRKISMDEFKKLIRVATNDQLDRLVASQLPENISSEVLDEAPYELRGRLEALIFEANAYHVNMQMELEKLYGAEINSSLALSKQRGDSPAHLLFKSKVKTLVELYNKSKTKPEILKSDSFEQLFMEVKRLLEDLRIESGALARARHYIEQRLLTAGPAYITTFKEAIKILTKRFTEIERSMNLYYYVSVMLAANEMNFVRDKIVELDRKAAMLKMQVDTQREQLAQYQASAISRRLKKHQITELQDSITAMLEEMKRYEVMISETDLLEWLDVVVEASMSGYVRKQAAGVIRTARLGLFGLLQKYCILQEEAAKQVARNPFSQVDPKKSIQYMIKSEQFILDYFAKKRSNITAWLGGAAQTRIESLGLLEKQLITEMRKNMKKVS